MAQSLTQGPVGTKPRPALDGSATTASAAAVSVAQIGARMHYAVPILLHQAGRLERLYTDICAVKGWPKLVRTLTKDRGPAALQRLAGRVPDGIPPRRIVSFSTFGLRYHARTAAAASTAALIEAYVWGAQQFCRRVVRCGLHPAAATYTFNGAGLEIMAAAREQGLVAIMEQTSAPLSVAWQLINQQRELFPQWEGPPIGAEAIAAMVARETAEWALADRVLCGSQFVVEGVRQVGGPVERCTVVPYGIGTAFNVDRPPHSGPLRVLTVGSVGIAKGSPQVLEAARLIGRGAAFRMIGALRIGAVIEQEIRRYVDLRGAVPRAAIAPHYAWADVFVLPSLCEGSATVTYEALAAGLPVICTANTGAVVTDGVDGFIVRAADPHAITAALQSLIRNRELLHVMSKAARLTARRYSLDAYGRRLMAATA
ncbi:glycosyltransferase family 4 protein [Candidatus Thiodictyon syntrophicum]|jgi:glycosyltransferase involved in cell wall biosynthesis|nr:glycosyltransferase family 4 protein [Candidatus Thiodictyon syntrophicum]